MRDDLRADRIQPCIAVGVVEVPVRVDQVRDRIGAEIGERLGHLRARDGDAGVHEHLAVGAGQDRDVSTGPFEHADVVAQLVGDDRRDCGAILDETDEAARLRERLREASAILLWL